MNAYEITSNVSESELKKIEARLAAIRADKAKFKLKLVTDLRTSLEKVNETTGEDEIAELLSNFAKQVRSGRKTKRGHRLTVEDKAHLDEMLKSNAYSIEEVARATKTSVSYVWMRKKALGLVHARAA